MDRPLDDSLTMMRTQLHHASIAEPSSRPGYPKSSQEVVSPDPLVATNKDVKNKACPGKRQRTKKIQEAIPVPKQGNPSSARKKPNLQAKTAWMKKDTGGILSTITHDTLQPDPSTVTSDTGFEVLCTYNWQMDGKAILVPGGPPKWTPPILPVTLPPDSGKQFCDQNASRVPKYPFMPAFQALAIMNPNISLDAIDIVANRNSLRKLLNFAAGKRQDPFRMDLHMVNNTLFISRREKHAHMMIHGAANSGYGHNLETAFTTPGPGLDRSSSHHRVIRYHLGPLNCAIRFEVDAYYETDALGKPSPDDVDDLAATVAQMHVQDTQPAAAVNGGTSVVRRGANVPSAQLAEVKARKSQKVHEAIPQLWFGRTPYLVTGEHTKGVVHSVKCTHVALGFDEWEAANQEKLRKMVGILVDLRRIVGGLEGGKGAALVCEEKGAPMKVLAMEKETGVLPRDVIARHWSV